MRKILVFVISLVLMFALSACCLSHDWQPATCKAPETCSKCGKTRGDLAEHTWEEATCTKPKTCSVCGKTEGKSLGHTWEEATCTEPKTCSVCGVTEGEALGHDWIAATTEAPKTCSVCGATEGTALIPVKWNEPFNIAQTLTCVFHKDTAEYYVLIEGTGDVYTTESLLGWLKDGSFDNDTPLNGSNLYDWLNTQYNAHGTTFSEDAQYETYTHVTHMNGVTWGVKLGKEKCYIMLSMTIDESCLNDEDVMNYNEHQMDYFLADGYGYAD